MDQSLALPVCLFLCPTSCWVEQQRWGAEGRMRTCLSKIFVSSFTYGRRRRVQCIAFRARWFTNIGHGREGGRGRVLSAGAQRLLSVIHCGRRWRRRRARGEQRLRILSSRSRWDSTKTRCDIPEGEKGMRDGCLSSDERRSDESCREKRGLVANVRVSYSPESVDLFYPEQVQ